MANNQLIEYIQTQHQQGYSDDQLRSALLGQGWQKKDVEEALSSAKKGAVKGKRRPGEVTLLAIIYFLLGLIGIPIGILNLMAEQIIEGIPWIVSSYFPYAIFTSQDIYNALSQYGVPDAIFTTLAGMFLGLSLLYLILGIGLLMLKHWARRITIALSVLGLLAFPIGTLYSIFFLVILLSKSTQEAFS